MTGREAQIETFLVGAGWDHATRAALAGDASARRYERLTDPASGLTAILMDSPTIATAPFAGLADLLRAAGLSAPAVMAGDSERGFLLLEDLGDATFTRIMARDPSQARPLYEAATDLLGQLQAVPPPPELTVLDSPRMADMTAIAFSHYAQPVTGRNESAGIVPRLENILHEHVPFHPVLVHRDYHADNLIWLAARRGPARVGLLDFQDAVIGHPAYDLVSLLQDARRDVSAMIEMAMIARFSGISGIDAHGLRSAYAVLGFQRNLRILGVFARLARDFAKPHYLALIPRVHAHVIRNLEHPVLAPLAQPVLNALPQPTKATLSRLAEAA